MSIVRVGFVGAGGMGRHHIGNIIKQADTTQIAAICEPDKGAYARAAALFEQAGRPVPPNEPDFARFMSRRIKSFDVGFINTPHNAHFEQTTALLEAGKDVLLEKPMVINASQARRLIKTRDKTKRLLVVAFPGSLSPQIRRAAELLRSGEFGKLLTISGTVWQNWEQGTAGKWRQEPKISGGGFMFDTGAHMLNTLADLAGEPFADVAAFLDNRRTKVDILAVAIARLQSGALVSINGCGAAIPSCESDVKIFCEKAILEVGIWGGYLKVRRAGESQATPVDCGAWSGVWQTFMAVRNGQMENPCPPEVGLRMAQLWDAIKASAKQNGMPVRVA